MSQAIGIVYAVYYKGVDLASAPWNNYDALLKASTNWGNLVGQIAFGILGDKLGRKRMYGVELIIMIVATIGSALAGSTASDVTILPILCLWRFFLGIGIGGDYPMSAVITSEFANVRYRGLMLAAVFSMQGIGILLSSAAILMFLAIFKTAIATDPKNLDYVWRACLLFGIIPASIALYFRLTIPETPRYTVDVVGDEDKAEKDVERLLHLNYVPDVTSRWGFEEIAEPDNRLNVRATTLDDFKKYFGQWKHAKILIGVAYSWFALDIAWYGLTLNSSRVLDFISYGNNRDMSQFDNLQTKAVGNILINLMGTVPGYFVSVALIEYMGRKPIQYMGFAVIAVCLGLLAAFWDHLVTNRVQFLVIYGIAQFFFNFGPNTTTFVVPGEVFPTRWRSTGHGIAAAAGKLGAIIGIQVVSPSFERDPRTPLWTFAAVMASGILSTMLIPETAGKTLEELSLEESPILTTGTGDAFMPDKDVVVTPTMAFPPTSGKY
eukprot:jgi/Hompol1/4287/HPOL_003568-RA